MKNLMTGDVRIEEIDEENGFLLLSVRPVYSSRVYQVRVSVLTIEEI